MRTVFPLVLVFLFFAICSSAAQDFTHPRWTTDRIKLRGSTSVRCKILGETPETVSIETTHGNFQEIRREEIEWIQRNPEQEYEGIYKTRKGEGR